eukprot:TRINITY_DN7881_c0_g1_i1.p1 TRINITY_DN7881_c0_g1~~TRINITY_DN7881_c0_g1_i1.p1  ORF type:complete len:958 (+),score=203.94 TRINITY_DN7881_c0_g1_i1:40-2913(+)
MDFNEDVDLSTKKRICEASAEALFADPLGLRDKNVIANRSERQRRPEGHGNGRHLSPARRSPSPTAEALSNDEAINNRGFFDYVPGFSALGSFFTGGRSCCGLREPGSAAAARRASQIGRPPSHFDEGRPSFPPPTSDLSETDGLEHSVWTRVKDDAPRGGETDGASTRMSLTRGDDVNSVRALSSWAASQRGGRSETGFDRGRGGNTMSMSPPPIRPLSTARFGATSDGMSGTPSAFADQGRVDEISPRHGLDRDNDPFLTNWRDSNNVSSITPGEPRESTARGDRQSYASQNSKVRLDALMFHDEDRRLFKQQREHAEAQFNQSVSQEQEEEAMLRKEQLSRSHDEGPFSDCAFDRQRQKTETEQSSTHEPKEATTTRKNLQERNSDYEDPFSERAFEQHRQNPAIKHSLVHEQEEAARIGEERQERSCEDADPFLPAAAARITAASSMGRRSMESSQATKIDAGAAAAASLADSGACRSLPGGGVIDTSANSGGGNVGDASGALDRPSENAGIGSWTWPKWATDKTNPCIEVYVEDDEDDGQSRWVSAVPINRVVDDLGADAYLAAHYDWDGEGYDQDFTPEHVRRRGTTMTVRDLLLGGSRITSATASGGDGGGAGGCEHSSCHAPGARGGRDSFAGPTDVDVDNTVLMQRGHALKTSAVPPPKPAPSRTDTETEEDQDERKWRLADESKPSRETIERQEKAWDLADMLASGGDKVDQKEKVRFADDSKPSRDTLDRQERMWRLADEAMLAGDTVQMPRDDKGLQSERLQQQQQSGLSVLGMDTMRMPRRLDGAAIAVAESEEALLQGKTVLMAPRSAEAAEKMPFGLDTVQMPRRQKDAGEHVDEAVLGLDTVQMKRPSTNGMKDPAEKVLGLDTVQMKRPSANGMKVSAEKVLGLDTVKMVRPCAGAGKSAPEEAGRPRISMTPKDVPRFDRQMLEAKLREIEDKHTDSLR